MKTRRIPFYEKGLNTYRNLLAVFMIFLTIVSIIYVSLLFHTAQSDASEKIFDALIPLFATWIGTILAFYFGRENFESASNEYKKIINQLSPEILDDILVNQIMITDKTMVSMELDQAKAKSVKALIDYLEMVNKSRLPVLENGKPKYIIHKSTLLDAQNKQDTSDMSFDDFVKQNTIITSFTKVSEDAILEDVLAQIKDQPNIKDIFVLNENGKVTGWLTNALILRYIQG